MKADSEIVSNAPSALDFFAAGLPASIIFAMSLDDIKQAIPLAQTEKARRIAELCFMGLISYFEAFCKDHAASVINIAPSLIENLRQAGCDTRVDAGRALDFNSDLRNKIGCLLMETYDFGNAKRINAIYGHLLKITPFSKDEINTYNQLLRDRNLLVHHGGTYTSKYVEQKTGMHMREAYWNSLVVEPNAVSEAMEFLRGIAKKIAQASHAALVRYFESKQVSLEPEHNSALNFLLWDETSEDFNDTEN